MQLPELIDAYKNERVSTEAFRDLRLTKGVVCKKCSGTEHYWLSSKKQFQCKQCRFRTTLQSGTVLEGSKLPVSYFFIGIHLLIKNGPKLTIEEFQEKTGHRYYDPLWTYIRKLKAFCNEESNGLISEFPRVVDRHFVTNQAG